MKTIYSEAKQQLGNCMLLHDGGDGDDYASSPSPILGLSSNNHNNNNNNHSNHFIPGATNQPIPTTITTSAYDTLQRPFKCDKQRGRWSMAADFYFASTSHAFGTITFSELPVFALVFGGVYFLPAYLIAILLYAIPIFAIQTFLGQFSTSGAISAFRVAPIFKGIGYSILVLNLTSLAYYGVIASVPLIYAINSLHTVIPWMSCDNAWNTANCSTHTYYDEEEPFVDPHSTVEFFRAVISSTDNDKSDFALSWPILCGVIGIWLFVLGLLLKQLSFIGKFFRCTYILLISFFFAIFVHLIVYKEITWSTIYGYLQPSLSSYSSIRSCIPAAILMATFLLGPGWGSILTLASHNGFRRDSEKLTYWVSITHVVLALGAIICGRIAYDHFEDHVGLLYYHVDEQHYMQFLYLCFAYLFGSFTSLPNLWSFLFFIMLFIAELSAVVIQAMSVLTALFDEYENLRRKKKRITVALVLLMITASVYFCTKRGFQHLHILPTLAILTHVIISILMLLMTTWIYGRERFQCDLQFMLGKTISNFKIVLIRLVTPVFLAICIFQIFFLLNESPTEFVIISQAIVYIVAPAYMIYKVCQTTGSWRNRLKQCIAPHDWHPVDADNRRFYEEVMGTSEMLVIDSEPQFMVNA